MQLYVLLALCAAAAAAPAEEFNHDDDLPISYHESFGIAEAARIRQYEQALNFDGSRIVGGDQVGPGAQPHLGGIIIHLDGNRTSVCGCSLLTSTRAVTAAHCWREFGTQARLFTVVYGSRFLYRGGVRIDTDDVVLHPNWNFFTFANDVAVIKHLEVTFSKYIQPINLPSGDELNQQFLGSYAYAAGYGRNGDDDPDNSDPEKRQVVLQVISNQECRSIRRGLGWRITASNICTSGVDRRSPCPGDSGGPLVFGSGDDRILIGITSFGFPNCTMGRPAGFTRVTSFVPWIRTQI